MDVAEVAVQALLRPTKHRNRAWTLTAGEALTYAEVAGILTAVLGRPIRCTRPGPVSYVLTSGRQRTMARGLVAASALICTTARLGLASALSPDLADILGRTPTTSDEFARRQQAAWQPYAV